MQTTSSLLLLSCLVTVPAAASAANELGATLPPLGGDETAVEIWTGDIGANGMRGVYRVDSGFPIRSGELVLLLGADFSTASDLFADGDTNARNSQQITAVWSPITNLALSLRQSVVSNRNTAFEPATTQNLGDPTLGLKYAVPVGKLGLGAVVALTLPTSAHGNGLNPEAFILSGSGALSFLATDFLSLSLNAGYRLDNSSKIFKRDLLPVQRFTAGISQVNAILGGFAVATAFRLGDMMVVGPFAELTAAIPSGAAVDQGPMRATLGARLAPFGSDNVELTVGGDYAIGGVPKPDVASKMAGIPPWEVFGTLAAHLGPKPKAAGKAASGPLACITDTTCTDGQVCVDGYCARLKEIVKEVVKEIERPIPSFTLEGGVFDQTTGDPIGSAVVGVSGGAGSGFAVDYKTGTFKSWPIPCGDGLIKVTVTAPGYRPYDETVPKGKPGEVKTLTLKLQNAGEAATGEIKGVLKDAGNGNPIKNGQIFIPILKQKISSDAEGKFTAQVKAGRYQVLISGPKYITQKKEVEIRAGDVVIFNVDMTRK